ncbi:MAG: ABC1 kinase family protein, partial [Anaerolineae bacterium]
IKLGQILSSRVDLLPAEMAAELALLHDAVPPEPLEVVEETIAEELGRPASEIFARLDPEPLGSASIGQVHAAELASGEEVVIKVQRPCVAEQVEEDLAIFMDLARLAQTHTAWGQVHDLPAIVEEFGQTLRSELDYVREGRNAERMARSLRHEKRLRVPAIHWPYTTRRVLTMERLHGTKVTDTEALRAAGIDIHEVSTTLLNVAFKMVLEDGFYHADPHPGNLLVAPGPVLGLVDCGMVGTLDREARENLVLLMLAMVDHDLNRMLDQLLALGVTSATHNIEALQRDMERALNPHWDLPNGDVDLHRCLDAILGMAYRRRVRAPASLILVSKTVMMYEALARHLDPRFSLVEVLEPYLRRLAWRTWSPQRQVRQLTPAVLDLGQLLLSLPRRAHRLLLQAERGNLSLIIRIHDIERISRTLDRLSSRLALAILGAGLAVGLALLLQGYDQQGLRPLGVWLAALALLGLLALGLRVAWAWVRRRRR